MNQLFSNDKWSLSKRVDEAALRTYSLIQLNARFDGITRGETFACMHNSDICIHIDGKNILAA